MYSVRVADKSKDIKNRETLTTNLKECRTGASFNEVLSVLETLPFEEQFVVIDKQGTGPVREFFIHFRPGCPNTLRALDAVNKSSDSFRVYMYSANDKTSNPKLKQYLRTNYPERAVTYPRVFREGELIGGATELIDHLQKARK
jgi:hypothetical protein